jgi:hypothetical protein
MKTLIDVDTFGEWQAHPITELLFRALAEEEERLKEQWVTLSLDGGVCDQIELTKFRERRNAYRDIRTLTAEQLQDLLA